MSIIEDFFENFLIIISWVLVICTFPLSLVVILRVIKQYERVVVFRIGRLRPASPLGPGIIYILPCIDTTFDVDIRVISLRVPPQEALTRESVTVQVDAVVYYKIFDANRAIMNVEDYHDSTQLLAMTMLRNMIGQKTLAELLAEKELIAAQFRQLLDGPTDPWGINIERVEIKNVILPTNMQRAMAAEAEATREARAKVIAAEGEMKASQALKEAAEIISQSSGALQLRYLETINTISSEKSKTIVFPLPTDLFAKFLR